MAAMALSRSAALAPCASPASRQQQGVQRSDASECQKLRLRSFEGLKSQGVFLDKTRSLKDTVLATVSRRRGGGGGALCAHMVAVPATSTRGADIEFNTDVFKKEKVTLAGRDEVGRAWLAAFFLCMLFFLAVSRRFLVTGSRDDMK
jgi:ketol-acid reductoisomerase